MRGDASTIRVFKEDNIFVKTIIPKVHKFHLKYKLVLVNILWKERHILHFW